MLGLRPGDDPANVRPGVGRARLRSAAYPAHLAFVRLRAAPGRALLVGLGIATGAAMLALAFGGSAAVRDRAVAEELARIGPSDSSLQVVWSGVPTRPPCPPRRSTRDARAVATSVVRADRSASLSVRRDRRVRQPRRRRRPARWFNYGADVPAPRTPQRCELVLVAPARCRVLRGSSVADGSRVRPSARSSALPARTGRRCCSPTALAVGGLPLPDAELIARTCGWVPIVLARCTTGRSRRSSIASMSRACGSARLIPSSASRPRSTRSPPREGTSRQVAASVRRGDVAVLLLAFAVLAAARPRRDADDARRCRRGAARMEPSSRPSPSNRRSLPSPLLGRRRGLRRVASRPLARKWGRCSRTSCVGRARARGRPRPRRGGGRRGVAPRGDRVFGTRALTTADIAAIGAVGAVPRRRTRRRERRRRAAARRVPAVARAGVFAASRRCAAARTRLPCAREQVALPLRLAVSPARRGGAAVVASRSWS